MALTKDDQTNYFFEDERLNTFNKNWAPLVGFKHCTPHHFAAAGFYNCSPKSSDNVKCFMCGKELDGWEKEDDPWIEHKKRGDHCFFVQMKIKHPDTPTFEEYLKLWYEFKKRQVIEVSQSMKSILIEDAKKMNKILKSTSRFV